MLLATIYINNSLHLARKDARIFVRGNYLFREASSFPRAKLEENCELRGTDIVQGQISEHIFAPNGGYCLYYPSNLFRNARNFQNWGILNNYWMRVSMISWIIKTEVCVICLSLRLWQITQTRGFDNSWYHAKTEFNNCFVEAKRSAILFLRTLQGA